MKTKITAYKGFLIIDTSDPKKSEGWVPNGDGKLGCILHNTKEQLGISEDAFNLLKTIKPSRDAIGDVMWFPSDDKFVFGWLGAPRRVIWAEGSDGDRNYKVRAGGFITIPNDVPELVKKSIDLSDSDPDAAVELYKTWYSYEGQNK